MEGIGNRLRKRALELDLSDAEVARRLGISQSRYANYVAGKRAPDFATLARICRLLSTTPNVLLGFDQTEKSDKSTKLKARITAATESMPSSTLQTAAVVMDALAALKDQV